MNYAGNWHAAYVLDAPPAAAKDAWRAGEASRAWSCSPTGPPRPTTEPFLVTGKVTSSWAPALLSAVGTLAERTTRYALLLHLGDDKKAVNVEKAMRRSILTPPTELRRSITWDQGAQMSAHQSLPRKTGIPSTSASRIPRGQRGSNENTNGLIRQFLPKSTELARVSAIDLRRIQRSLNNRPRKTLEYTTPSEKLAQVVALTPGNRQFARLSSAFSHFSRLTSAESCLETPGRAPLSTWACWHHLRTVSGVSTPSSPATLLMAAHPESCSMRTSATIRTTRSRKPHGHPLDLAPNRTPTLPRTGVSGHARAVQFGPRVTVSRWRAVCCRA